jgi:hypothetical protein
MFCVHPSERNKKFIFYVQEEKIVNICFVMWLRSLMAHSGKNMRAECLQTSSLVTQTEELIGG